MCTHVHTYICVLRVYDMHMQVYGAVVLSSCYPTQSILFLLHSTTSYTFFLRYMERLQHVTASHFQEIAGQKRSRRRPRKRIEGKKKKKNEASQASRESASDATKIIIKIVTRNAACFTRPLRTVNYWIWKTVQYTVVWDAVLIGKLFLFCRRQ